MQVRTCRATPSPPEVDCVVSSHNPAERPDVPSPRVSSRELLVPHGNLGNIFQPVGSQKMNVSAFIYCIHCVCMKRGILLSQVSV